VQKGKIAREQNPGKIVLRFEISDMPNKHDTKQAHQASESERKRKAQAISNRKLRDK
jgi:hypothetical protein